MCGICGIFYFDPNQHVDEQVLQAMTMRLLHRGPDEAGFYQAGSVGFGVRRLNIIDVNGSHQPISNEDKRLWVACNGEIYNFRSLRTSLSGNHHFGTEGDVESIVHLYEDYGLRCVDHLHGMFAFCLWDAALERLTLAVDRFGKKPIYYSVDSDKIVFGSELKAFINYPGIDCSLDYEALDEYLTYGAIPAPHSIFTGVRKLPPGHWLTVARDGSVCLEQYWHPTFAQSEEWDKRSVDELAEELRSLLINAVQLRLESDVPIGAFLSGGVDSSAVVALMTTLSGNPVKTFSIGFDEATYDESAYAQAAANYFHTDHICQNIRGSDVGALLPKLVHAFDEPFADASMIPTYVVSQLAQQHVKVVLSGDGGDEVFAGYHHHLYGYRQQFLESHIPGSLHQLAARTAKVIPRAAKIAPYLAAIGQPAEYWIGNTYFSPLQRNRLYGDRTHQTLAGERTRIQAFSNSSDLDRLSQMQYHDLTLYLPSDILVKVDRASMLASLEVRCPLLDHTVFEFMASVLPQHRISVTGGKKLLKMALRGLLPPSIAHRKKQGFSIPQAEWLRGVLNPMMRDLLLNSRLSDVFDRSYIAQLVEEHQSRQADHKDRLWALLCFELWRREI